MSDTEFNIPPVPHPNDSRFIDLTGRVFGRLTALYFIGKHTQRFGQWLCRCECGKFTTPAGSTLRGGTTKSCGCFGRDQRRDSVMTHGMSRSPTNRIWQGMKYRCLNVKSPKYKHYGGRGIAICERWLNSFEHFLEDMGERPGRQYSLERQDNDGDYTPENCYWATAIEQANNKRTTHFITFNGKTQSLVQWERELGFNLGTLRTRIHDGWSIERAFTEPCRIVKK